MTPEAGPAGQTTDRTGTTDRSSSTDRTGSTDGSSSTDRTGSTDRSSTTGSRGTPGGSSAPGRDGTTGRGGDMARETGTADREAETAGPRVAPTQRVRSPEPATSDPVTAAWTEYLAAARQLDGVRRGAATAAGEQARSVQAAREELAAVRARLASQQTLLRELGVPAMSLVPSPPEVGAAARSMVAGPAAVLAGLRTARECADEAEGLLAARRTSRPTGWPALRGDLLGYGLLALLVPVLQLVVLGLTGTGAAGVLAALLGLPLAVLAFVVRRPAVARLSRHLQGRDRTGGRPAADGLPDRGRWFGALVCGVPAAVTAAGILLVVLLG
ncbi:hypothetical protein [Micromonospora cathayae]|uniref:Uncharacterized protein n=1 Tax=Micromonospora cathayae TaxID=3028804 RepID=A0ABY7ZT94_9ACTN|nr:hypothetical protein [Micromonospora sp. HUAS 3]WDZ85713.1 hypothetical protein PVK37_04495 [Micromonospora sp. HUAS 3]